ARAPVRRALRAGIRAAGRRARVRALPHPLGQRVPVGAAPAQPRLAHRPPPPAGRHRDDAGGRRWEAARGRPRADPALTPHRPTRSAGFQARVGTLGVQRQRCAEDLEDTVQGVDPLTPGALLADRYRIGSLLGAGGMSFVHRAVDETLGREVAVKALIRTSAEPVELERIGAEIDLLATLSHRALVTLYDAGTAV